VYLESEFALGPDAATVAADEPVSPELMLVAEPEVARVARQKLPDPEPLDEWVRRMRWAETDRAIRAFMAEAEARQRREELLRTRVGAVAFAAACALISLLPVLGIVLGA
jgi:hypothetical protein